MILVIGGRSKIGAALVGELHPTRSAGIATPSTLPAARRAGANALVGLYQDYRRSGTDGYAARVTGTVERLTGRPARSLDDLLGEIAPSLRRNRRL